MTFNWETGFVADFSLTNGLSSAAVSSKRRLSDMRGMYRDGEALEAQIAGGDPRNYEIYEMDAPPNAGHLAP
ncbi:MAG: glucose-6-phosphate isomerase, partial [Defluviitaleaceae bacterium]|nr:glucose-6-phosphate isomerase [Defluviitaleaceae bacterium]